MNGNNLTPPNPITPEERARLVELHVEVMEFRLLLADLNLSLAVQVVGPALKRLGEG